MSEQAVATLRAMQRVPKPSSWDVINFVVALALAKACGVL